jgi:hypothetical protein
MSFSVDDLYLIGLGAKTGIGTRDVVSHDKVKVLALHFGACIPHQILGLSGETHHALMSFLTSHFLENVRIPFKLDQRLCFILFYFARQSGSRWSEIGHRGGLNQDIGIAKPFTYRIKHLASRTYTYNFHSSWVDQIRRPADQLYLAASSSGGSG